MQFAVDQVLMNRRVESGFHLRGGTVEANPGAAARRNDGRETLLAQPTRHAGHVARADSEALGILFRRKPLVIVRRGRIKLLPKQSVQAALLLRGELEDQLHAFHRQ